ncbi:MAG: polymerase sigma factor RpoE [Desertimonas sp.]|nr:polymerase sigma factor RpoE [Desertimonas sp.]
MSAALQLWEAPVDVTAGSAAASFEQFIADAQVRLRRALVARYGVQLGVEACAEATAWAWANRDRLLAMANPVGYLYRVGQTAVRNESRFHKAPLFPVETRDPELPAGDPGLQQALTRLTPDQRAAVMLVHAHGYRYAEAADLLDIPISTLKNHLHRGSRRLRKLLEQRS